MRIRARLLYAIHRRQKRKWMRIPFEERIAISAQALRDNGISPLAALAAAEAIELANEHGLRYDRVEFEEHHLRWVAHYEAGPVRDPTWVTMPLTHATEATQRGIATLN